jgi:murein DD-endopeptidase MepM/ murein hydrolase activator NlpD
MALSRRSLLLGLIPATAGLALAACDGEERSLRIGPADASEAGTETPRPAAGTAMRTRPAPSLALPREPISQGGMFQATLSGDGLINVTAEFMGRRFATIEENGAFLTFVPVGQMIGATEQVPPGTYPVAMHYEIAGLPLPRTLEGSVSVTPTDFPTEILTFTPQVAALLEPARVEQETAMLRAAYGGFTPLRLWDGGFTRPSPAEISDVYGSRRSYQGGPTTGSHAGVDFGAVTGVPVLAAADGRVVLAQMMPVRGNMVILDHGAGVYTGYCHLASFSVEVGQDVRAGERIAATGATGLATGPHLHWEVVAGGMHVDGLRWLRS